MTLLIGTVLLYCPGEVQGLLSRVLQLVMCSVSSLGLMTSKPDLPSATGGEGLWERAFAPSTCYHMVDELQGQIFYA